MYLALFLTPWVLMYALSTMVMNHRELFRQRYGGAVVLFEKEKEVPYAAVFAAGTRPQEIGERILKDLQLEGTFNARREPGGNVTVVRQDPITPRRITFHPAQSKLVVEREAFRAQPFLERMHRRRGYQHPYLLEDSWAVSVDVVIIAMVFWVLSGLWMWWELRATRMLGAIFIATGVILFSLFLYRI